MYVFIFKTRKLVIIKLKTCNLLSTLEKIENYYYKNKRCRNLHGNFRSIIAISKTTRVVY